REVDSGDAEAEGEKADAEAERDARGDREPDAGPGPDAVVEEQPARRVRADADVERVPERELPGEAHHHIPRLAGVGEEQDQRGDRQRVAAREKRQRDGRRAERDEAEAGAAQVFLPSRPCGLNRSTRISSPKLNMPFAEGATKRPAIASDTPIRSPP